jgi:RNA-splicing ligase RtcB
MRLVNLSAEPEGRLYSWLPHDLRAEVVVFLPDACPGKSPLPTGTAILTQQDNWRKFAVSDCGCGMRLMRTTIKRKDLTQQLWDDLATALSGRRGLLGDLGGGNHFLDALCKKRSKEILLLIHTGSRNESGIVDEFVNSPGEFDRAFRQASEWARANREEVARIASTVLGPMELILDSSHNGCEDTGAGGVIIRKGAVRIVAGERAVIPSHIMGDVAIVRATEWVADILNSLSHGTGRTVSRSEAKEMARKCSLEALRKKVLLPSGMDVASLRTEGPFAYRDLDSCLKLLTPYIEVLDRLQVVGYMGRL